MIRFRALSTALLISLFLIGCASAGKFYDRAAEAEAEDNAIAAAENFLKALDKEPGFRDAQQRLAVVGTKAVDDLWTDANRLRDSGASDRALDVVIRLRSLVSRSARHNVTLREPEGLASFRQQVTDQATEDAFSEADNAIRDGRWPAAISIFDRMFDRYQLSLAENNQVRLGRIDAYLGWARESMDGGAYRLAHEKAGETLKLTSGGSRAEADALEIQSTALFQGTRAVAMTALWQTESFRRTAPELVRLDITESVGAAAFDAVPLFLEVIEPIQVRRTVRALGLDREVLSRAQLQRIAQRLDADFISGGELTSFSRTETVKSESTVRARTRGRGAVDTTYARRDVEITIEVRIAYRIVDAAGSDVISSAEIPLSASGRFERGAYAGNPDHLDLDGNERRLFDSQEWLEQEYGLERQLVDEAAVELTRRIFEASLGRVR